MSDCMAHENICNSKENVGDEMMALMSWEMRRAGLRRSWRGLESGTCGRFLLGWVCRGKR